MNSDKTINGRPIFVQLNIHNADTSPCSVDARRIVEVEDCTGYTKVVLELGQGSCVLNVTQRYDNIMRLIREAFILA